MAVTRTSGFVPPPYPYERLDQLRIVGDRVPGGIIDCSVGTPVDPMPEVALTALREAAATSTGYPPSIGSPSFRVAATAWLQRRLGVAVDEQAVIACVGTKELVASLPRLLALRDPSRDTVLYPAVSYPTYAMGAQLAGLRAVPVPVDERWRCDLGAVAESDARRALVCWLNDPANPTGVGAGADGMRRALDWARDRSVIVASDECYAEFTCDEQGAPAAPVTALGEGHEGVLSVHSLSKRSNMAGLRAGFVAGDRDLVGYLGEVRKHAGMMVPAPTQAAATAALADDAHVQTQRERYARRRSRVLPALESWGLVHDGGPSTFYLWLRKPGGREDGWSIAARLADAGVLVAPGDLYGPDGARHVRLALSVNDEQIDGIIDRLGST